MRIRYVAALAVAVVLLGRCGPDLGASPPVDGPATPHAAPEADRAAEEPAPGPGTALAALRGLPVKGRAPLTGYDRDRFGPAWLDADRNGCDTRNDVLREHLDAVTMEANGCVVAGGVHLDPYTGSRIDYRQGDGALVDIDHVVALGNAWVTGATAWSVVRRAAFANDPLNLLPADAGANRQKGDGDAATWLPAHRPFRCAYVARQVAVKAKYGLWVTAPEHAALERVLDRCPTQPPAPDPWRAPTEVDHRITDPGPTTGEPTTSFPSCDAARAAGAVPVRRGDAGYGEHLDGDGDGSGCE